MRISDWSSDVCSSDLAAERDTGTHRPAGAARAFFRAGGRRPAALALLAAARGHALQGKVQAPPTAQRRQTGRASCRERVGQNVKNPADAVAIKKKNTQAVQNMTRQ